MVCIDKRKLSAYIFGLVNCILYVIISLQVTLYGETILSIVYYIPMYIHGLYMCIKGISHEKSELCKKHMSNRHRLILIAFIVAGTITCGFMLKMFENTMPFINSFTVVSSIVAIIISIKMFSEQWWIRIAVSIVSIYMWSVLSLNNDGSVAILLMWIVYLVNNVIICIRWEKDVHSEEKYIHELFNHFDNVAKQKFEL